MSEAVDPKTEEARQRFYYRCYLEAYTQARSHGVVTASSVLYELLEVDDGSTLRGRPDGSEALLKDTTVARAIAIGASDGSRPLPQPQGEVFFGQFLRGEKRSRDREDDRR